MTTSTPTTAPISGLLSLVAGAVEPAYAGASAQSTDLAAVLGQLAGGWMALKEDGEGWVLLQFAPHAATSAAARQRPLRRTPPRHVRCRLDRTSEPGPSGCTPR